MPVYQDTDHFLVAAHQAIEAGLTNPTIQDYLKELGYNQDRLQQGKTFLQAALDAQNHQQKTFGDQVSATAQVETAFNTARRTYMRFVKIARIALPDNPGAHQELAIDGQRLRSRTGFIAQARQFYRNAQANPLILEALAAYNIAPTDLKTGEATVNALETARLHQERAKGTAQTATQTRNAAHNALKQWLRDYLAIARIALEPKPQMLEALGIIKPS